jgi:4-diphosphocytidyl-2-C-methyl-D-erythritol kinase
MALSPTQSRVETPSRIFYREAMEVLNRADVPFLVSETAFALAWGRGERMVELRPPPRRQVELLIPPFGVSTRWAYEQLAATRRDIEPHPITHSLAALSSWDDLTDLAVNDLEPLVSARHPEIASSVVALRARGARIAMMSGAGSVVFGIFDRLDHAVSGTAAGVKSLRTRTATRVVGVQRIE